MYMASVTSQFLWLDDCIGYVELLCTLGEFHVCGTSPIWVL